MAELVLDLETKKSFDDVGGRHNFHLLEVSVVGVYDYASGSFISFFEHQLADLEQLLGGAGRVIGFNHKNFDWQVLQPHVRLNLASLPALDIMEDIANRVGFRVSLNGVAHATLGEQKTGDGLQALRLYKEGKLQELAAYCLQDVKLTRDIYEYGKEKGEVFFLDKWYGNRVRVPVSWT